MSAKKVLGRGLSAIIEDVEEAYKQDIEQAKDLVETTDKVCPYSNAVRGNVDVRLHTQVVA